MGIKLQINNSNFIFENKDYPIVETFIDFILSFGDGLFEKAQDLLIDLKNNKDYNKYNIVLKRKNFSIFYLPALNLPSFNNNEDFDYWIENTILEFQYLSNYISKFKQAIDMCFNLSIDNYKDLTLNQRYALCLYSNLLPKNAYSTNTFIIPDYSTDISPLFDESIRNNYNIIKKTNEPNLNTYVEFNDINSMCLFAFNKMFEQNIIIKKCKNCNKLFIADNKREYCDRIQENGLKCSQIGYSFKEKKKNDLLLQEYMKAYKRVQNFYYKNKSSISTSVKDTIFANLRSIYDKAQNDITNKEKYLKKFEKYNYDNLKEIYILTTKKDDELYIISFENKKKNSNVKPSTNKQNVYSVYSNKNNNFDFKQENVSTHNILK